MGWGGGVVYDRKIGRASEEKSFRRPVGFWNVFVGNLTEFWYQNGDLATIYMMGGVILEKKRSSG